jgi:uncharacterized protein (UPF0335 family)
MMGITTDVNKKVVVLNDLRECFTANIERLEPGLAKTLSPVWWTIVHRTGGSTTMSNPTNMRPIELDELKKLHDEIERSAPEEAETNRDIEEMVADGEMLVFVDHAGELHFQRGPNCRKPSEEARRAVARVRRH